MSDVRYQSGESDALGPDERVIFEVEHPARRLRFRRPSAIAVRVTITIVVMSIVIAIGQYAFPKGRTSDLAIVFPFAIGLVACGFAFRDPSAVSVGPRTTRVTNERILQRGAVGPRQLTIEETRRVEVVSGGSPAAIVTIANMPFDNDGSLRPIVAGLRALVVRGLDERASARRWRRAWRPSASLGTSDAVTPPIDPQILAELSLALLDGEDVLWAGRPTFSRRAAIRRRLRSLRAAAPWAIAACAAVASPFLVGWRGNAPMLPVATVAAVIGGLVLFVMFHAQVLEPRRAAIERRRSRYILTNRRVICRVTTREGVRESSSFFDDATEVDVTFDADVDGLGTVSIGYHNSFVSIADAKSVYALAVRAVAGARFGDDSPVASALPATPPRV